MTILPITEVNDPDWLPMRHRLWPDGEDAEHLEEMASQLAEPQRYAQFIARAESDDERGEALGFAEAALRHDYVPGTERSLVAFLEGLYVEPAARQQGVARRLVQAVTDWARRQGCQELASDTQLDNLLSQDVHRQLGFQEAERVVFFVKTI